MPGDRSFLPKKEKKLRLWQINLNLSVWGLGIRDWGLGKERRRVYHGGEFGGHGGHGGKNERRGKREERKK